MTVMRFLQDSKLFGGLRDEQLQGFFPICQHVVIELGASIFRKGEPARFLYIVGQGRVALEMTMERPDGSVTPPTLVASVGLGETFGWSAIVEPHILTLSARAVERCNLVRVEGEALREVLNKHRELGYLVMVNVAKLLAQRLSETREAFVYERGWVWKAKYSQTPWGGNNPWSR